MTVIEKHLSGLLSPLFEKLPIEVVYLYGSYSRGENDTLSDYDFGLLFSEKVTGKKRFDLRLELFCDIAEKLKIDSLDIDVVDLKEVPVLLQFNVISGKVIYCRNENKRINYEAYVMGRYADEHYYLDRFFHDTMDKIMKGVYFERRTAYA